MVEGDKVEVSVDNKKIIKAKDPDIPKGQIALITEQRLPLTVMDDFVVRVVSKKTLFGKKINGRETQPSVQVLSTNSLSSIPTNSFISHQKFYYQRTIERGPNKGDGSEPFELINSSTYKLHYQRTTERGPSEGNDLELFALHT